MAEKSRLYERFEFYFNWFRYVGVNIPSTQTSLMFKLYSMVSVIHLIWHLTAMLIAIVTSLDDLKYFIETIHLVGPSVAALYTTFFIRQNNNDNNNTRFGKILQNGKRHSRKNICLRWVFTNYVKNNVLFTKIQTSSIFLLFSII